MKIKYVSLLFVILACSCASEKKLLLTNTGSLDRVDEPVVVERAKIVEILGEIADSDFIVVNDHEGNEIPSQMDDLDGDGVWDELAFVCNIPAGAELSLELTVTDHASDYPFRTNIRFANKKDPGEEYTTAVRLETALNTITQEHFQMEGPAWENDIIGFRNYFDQRNGMDIFGKKVEDMILDGVGIDEDYHSMQDWGMDVLKVGNSLGSGSIGMIKKDSLFRIGDSGNGTYEQIVEGPVRSIFKLSFTDWICGDESLSIDHVITIWAGSNGYVNDVLINGMESDGMLITGLVNMHTDTLFINEYGDYTTLATHGPQAELEKYLGMGLIIPKSIYAGDGTAPEEGPGITQTYYGKLTTVNGKPMRFHFIAGWEDQDQKYINLQEFLKAIEYEALRLTDPIEMK